MIEPVSGILLEPNDAQYLLEAFEVLLRDRRPSAQLAAFIDRLRRTVAKAGDFAAGTGTDARTLGGQPDPGHYAPYDVLDTAEAAAVLGITGNGVRDLARRGSLPAHRAGGRWLYPAAAVAARAECRAAMRG